MKYLILNGNPGDENPQFDDFLVDFSEKLDERGNDSKIVTLRNKKIASCTGCFKCWIKTPGECVIADDAREIAREYINADMVILSSPLILGYFSALMKKTLDRSIPVIHPHLEEVDGEVHHRKRYNSYPRAGIILEKQVDTDEEDIDIAKDLFERMCINMRTELKFIAYTDQSLEEVLNAAVIS